VRYPTVNLDDLVHQRVRLGVLAVLAEADRAEFTYLRDTLEVTDGNLARHLQALEEAGYVVLTKTVEGGRRRTWVAATRRGRRALTEELSRLQALLERLTRPEEAT
jgi:DNA-binding MarR family transcriptional regulator